MCGIAGILRFDRSARVRPATLQAMGDALAHRGPDDEGRFVDGNVGLAHRRLSIIDLEGGRQPLFNEDRSVAVVFNGEIYNYADLTADLAARGHVFATRSDTETIVHAYEERGERCVEDFRGMFAFALWDRRRRRLLLARDRLGIKPLYYFLGPGLLAFASEIKALLEHPEVPREVDPEALDLYLSLRYVPGPRTLFRGIRKLPPGHTLTWDERGLSLREYWDLAAHVRPEGERAVPGNGREPRRRLADLLEESVRLRLMSEVPLGVFLSGGLDSTTVLAMMRRIAPGGRLRTFSVGYEGRTGEEERANEFDYARLAAESFGAEHHELKLRDADFRDFLPDLVRHLDEPVADPACVPLYFISRLARDEITVVLSGEGADEILAGYGVYRRMLALERMHRLGGGLGGRLAGLAAAARGPGERLRLALRLASLPLEQRYRGVSRGFLPEAKARLLGHDATAVDGDGLLDEVFGPHFAAVAGAAPLDRMLYADVKTWLPDDLLVKADKMTMANSLELRVPFLDHRLVELAASLPPEDKLRRGTGKALLRDAVAGLVPPAIVERTKRGFPVPMVPLLRRLGGFSRELLLARDSACRSWFDAAEVERLLAEHERGTAQRDQEIWSLLVFELWHGVFIDRRFESMRPGEPQWAGRLAAAGA